MASHACQMGYCNMRWRASFAVCGVVLAFVPFEAKATPIPLGEAANYAVLYEGTGGHNLSISNVTINGNVGVGGTGVVQFSGPGTIAGTLDFSAANGGQFHNTNGGNIGPTSTNYSDANVTSALNTVNSLSSSLAGLGNALAININGTNQTVNESTGTLVSVGGVTYRVFNVTSYTANNGFELTVNGDGSGDPVVFNFGFNSNVGLGGDGQLTGGLTDDQVLYNFTSSGQNISLNNNASSFPLPDAFQGDILAPNDALSLVSANLDGRVLGGDSSDMQIVSGDTIDAPATQVPEPSTLALFAAALAGLFSVAMWRRQRAL
jgi:choice-of-anchor A domain-containing protein